MYAGEPSIEEADRHIESGGVPDNAPVGARSGRDEWRVLLLTLICLAVFAVFALAVATGSTQELDRSLLLWFRDTQDTSDAWGPAWFEEAAAEVTTLGGYTILTVVIVLTAVSLFLLRKATAAIFLIAAVATGSLVSSLAKRAFSRPRPDLVEHMDVTFTSSFPSAHAMVSAFTWLTLAAIAARFVPGRGVRVFILLSAAAISVLVGTSRVYLGVHWPSDVIAGWAFGAAWAGICWLLANWLGRALRRRREFGADGSQEFETETAR
jgi:undecaprenyl-diphosphatase